MTRFRSRVGPREQGAATVVGAILVVSVLVLAIITFRTTYVPVWEEEAEQEFMDRVADALLQVRGNLDQHAVEQGGRLTTAVPTSQGSSIPSAPPREGNILAVENQTRSVTVHADDANVWRRNGTLQVREDIRFSSVPSLDVTIAGIDEILDFRIRFATLDSGEAGDSFVVRVLGSTGGLQGVLRYSVVDTKDNPGDHERSELVATVEDASGDVVFDQTIATFTQTQNDHEVDALDPWIGFDQILGSASRPFRLVLVESGLEASRALTFQKRNLTSDATVVSPAGGPTETVHRTLEGGHLRYESRNNFYVDQTYRIEQGALILEQAAGEEFRAGPKAPSGRVEALLGQDRAAFGFDVPSLVGPNRTMAGAGVVSVATDPVGHEGVAAVAAEAHVNVSTDNPDAWASWARDHYRDAGLLAGEFSVTAGSGFVNVTVEGPSTDPAVDDVHLDLTRTRITTTLER